MSKNMQPKFEKHITLFPFEKVKTAPRATCPPYEPISRSSDVVSLCSGVTVVSTVWHSQPFFITALGCEVQREQNWRCKGFTGRNLFHLKLPCDATFHFMNGSLRYSVFQAGHRVYDECETAPSFYKSACWIIEFWNQVLVMSQRAV